MQAEHHYHKSGGVAVKFPPTRKEDEDQKADFHTAFIFTWQTAIHIESICECIVFGWD